MSSTGEFAHPLQPVPGLIQCSCGRTDHVEAVASGLAIEAAYAAATGDDRVRLRDVARRMRDGDSLTGAAVTDAARLLGRAIAGLLTAVDAHTVVGGGMAQFGPDFLGPFADVLRTEGKLTVSCQAGDGDPLRDTATQVRMARAVQAGGALAIRCGGLADVQADAVAVDVPVTGLKKVDTEGVFITPAANQAFAVPAARA
ncbi:ROK family protein [Catenulispora rubra]|uniref:ROK family protein n=1 Tax=Catenulispora rubra TaxID=280293 RepID=UPI0018927E4D|nr:ROK family protein [Catenulispora rubra]